MSEFTKITLAGLDFAALSETEVVDRVRAALDRGEGGRIATPNVDILRQAARDPRVRADLDTADLLVADGTPLVWASRLARQPLPERVTGSGLIWSLSAGLALDGRSVYLLGGEPGPVDEQYSGAERAAEVLVDRFPGLRIAGHASPPHGFDRDENAFRATLQRVILAEPDMVFVGLGFPKQERIISLLRHELPATWFLGCGAAINFVAGDQTRAPLWMQRGGLEWVHRLANEPTRLAGRYLCHDAPYALRLLATAALTGRDSAPGPEPASDIAVHAEPVAADASTEHLRDGTERPWTPEWNDEPDERQGSVAWEDERSGGVDPAVAPVSRGWDERWAADGEPETGTGWNRQWSAAPAAYERAAWDVERAAEGEPEGAAAWDGSWTADRAPEESTARDEPWSPEPDPAPAHCDPAAWDGGRDEPWSPAPAPAAEEPEAWGDGWDERWGPAPEPAASWTPAANPVVEVAPDPIPAWADEDTVILPWLQPSARMDAPPTWPTPGYVADAAQADPTPDEGRVVAARENVEELAARNEVLRPRFAIAMSAGFATGDDFAGAEAFTAGAGGRRGLSPSGLALPAGAPPPLVPAGPAPRRRAPGERPRPRPRPR
jgi:N-acetylglucosaminyldiphosphoundecaprenol N-acetyl-beta-D-mannosaminyltransferase